MQNWQLLCRTRPWAFYWDWEFTQRSNFKGVSWVGGTCIATLNFGLGLALRLFGTHKALALRCPSARNPDHPFYLPRGNASRFERGQINRSNCTPRRSWYRWKWRCETYEKGGLLASFPVHCTPFGYIMGVTFDIWTFYTSFLSNLCYNGKLKRG